MTWLSNNWIWLTLGVGVLAFFAFGRGGCGMGHGGHDHRRQGEGDQSDSRRETTVAPLSTPAAGARAAPGGLPSTGHVHNAPSATQGALAGAHAGHDSGPGQSGRKKHRHGC